MQRQLEDIDESTTLLKFQDNNDSVETSWSSETVTALPINKWEVIPSLWCGAFLAALDSTIVTATYPIIGADFQRSDQASWVATLYMLSSSAFQPLYGGLSDMFGRKPVLLWSNSIFLIGSFGCVIAQSMNQLFVARVIAGVGGAGLGTLSSIIVSDLVPLKERSTYNGFANLVFGVGQVVGAPIGGYLADSLGWRYAFLIQCPITLASIITIYFRVHIPLDTNKKRRIKDIDFFGSIFLICGVVFILLSLQMAKNVGLTTGPIVAFISSIICFIAVFYIESRVANPIISLKVLLSRNPLLAGLTNFFGYMGYFAITFNLPLFLQVVLNESASKAGSRLIVSIAAMCMGSLTAGYITRRTHNYYWVAVFGVISEVVGSLLASSFLQSTESWKFNVYLFPSGLGHGLVLSATLMAIISSVTKENQAKATSMSYLFRVLGSSFGIALTALFNSYQFNFKLGKLLEGNPEGPQIIDRISKSVKDINLLPEELRNQVTGAFSEVIHTSFRLVVVIELVSLGFASCLKQFDLNR